MTGQGTPQETRLWEVEQEIRWFNHQANTYMNTPLYNTFRVELHKREKERKQILQNMKAR